MRQPVHFLIAVTQPEPGLPLQPRALSKPSLLCDVQDCPSLMSITDPAWILLGRSEYNWAVQCDKNLPSRRSWKKLFPDPLASPSSPS